MSDNFNKNFLLKEAAKATSAIQTGSGIPVVLLHGLAASNNDWTYLIPELVDAGYACFAPDLLGHGDSVKPGDARFYHIELLYAHLASWLNHQQLSVPAILVGHSMGGYLSLLYATRHPEKVRALILIDPLFSDDQLPAITGMLKRHPTLVSRMMEKIPMWLIYALSGLDTTTARFISPNQRTQVAEDYKRASPHVLHIMRSIAKLDQHFGEIDRPTLVVWGDHDRTLPPRVFPRLVNGLADARGLKIHGGGHQPHLSHPGEVNPRILEFLDELSIQ